MTGFIGRREFVMLLGDDCVAGAAGFEPLHLEIRSAEIHPASTGFRRRSGAPLIRDVQVRVPPTGLRSSGEFRF